MQKWKLIVPMWALLICSCEISDEDRCIDGQVFDPLYGVCYEAVEGPDTSISIDTDSNDNNVPEVMKACQSNADCATNGSMTFCLPNGFDTTQPGACVQDDCVPDACPAAQECCDCAAVSMFGWPSPLCWPEDMVEGTYGVETFGCTCTPNTTTAPVPGVAGVSCTSNAECAGNGQVDYCLANPFEPTGPGTCYQDACTTGACEVSGEECCDCSMVTFIDWPSNLCMPAEMLTGPYGLETAGCSCN